MKTYSNYQGVYRTCEYCFFSDWDEGDMYITGGEGDILCTKDETGELDLNKDSMELAKNCPFWKNEYIESGSFFTSPLSYYK